MTIGWIEPSDYHMDLIYDDLDEIGISDSEFKSVFYAWSEYLLIHNAALNPNIEWSTRDRAMPFSTEYGVDHDNIFKGQMQGKRSLYEFLKKRFKANEMTYLESALDHFLETTTKNIRYKYLKNIILFHYQSPILNGRILNKLFPDISFLISHTHQH